MTRDLKRERIIAFAPMIAEELPFLLSVRNQVREYLHDRSEFTIEEATKWWQVTDSRYWILYADQKKVGYFRAKHTADGCWQIGADIDPAFHRRGIASIAYPRFVKEVLVPLGARDLELRVLKSNNAAYALYVKLGFLVQDETEIDIRMTASVQTLI
jgi:RimJ/RimL family protein N-acetyltransferase